MAVLNLRYAPDPVLQQKAKRVRNIDAALRKLVDSMIETLRTENGVGLAANQVGDLRKVAVIQLPEDDEVLILINPEITRREGEREVEEGCLSIPGYRGLITRSETVRAKATDLDGKIVRIKADGLLAQALEHETDHLNGILYITHVKSPENFHKMEPEDEGEEETQEEPQSDPAGTTAAKVVMLP